MPFNVKNRTRWIFKNGQNAQNQVNVPYITVGMLEAF